MFELNLSIEGDKKESIKISRFDKTKKANLKRGIDRGTNVLNRQIVQRKLSGQVLRVRTDMLRSSFHIVRAREQPGVGIYGLVSTNIVYARIHEKGFTGTVIVRAHTRRTGPVRQHSRQLNVRARRYAETALRETKRPIATGIIRELMRPLK
jgi:hypothetical protein